MDGTGGTERHKHRRDRQPFAGFSLSSLSDRNADDPPADSSVGHGIEDRCRFIIDPRGAIERIAFAGVPDRRYNEALLKHFRSFNFRPAMTVNGKPVRGHFLFTFDFGR